METSRSLPKSPNWRAFASPLLSLQSAERMLEHKDLGRCGGRLSLPRYIATMLAQQVIALQTELHRPKPL
jgi:hypothetical protein